MASSSQQSGEAPNIYLALDAPPLLPRIAIRKRKGNTIFHLQLTKGEK